MTGYNDTFTPTTRIHLPSRHITRPLSHPTRTGNTIATKAQAASPTPPMQRARLPLPPPSTATISAPLPMNCTTTVSSRRRHHHRSMSPPRQAHDRQPHATTATTTMTAAGGADAAPVCGACRQPQRSFLRAFGRRWCLPLARSTGGLGVKKSKRR